MDEKRLDPEVERKIKEEIDKWPALSNFHYTISEDGKEISAIHFITVISADSHHYFSDKCGCTNQ